MAYSLRKKKPMVFGMEGKGMSKHQHRMKYRSYSKTPSHLQATTASIRSPMTTTVLTDFTATNDSLEGHKLQAASQTS